jgi:hypothetical protein
MARKGGSFGIVMLLVVMLAVLMLVAKNWRKVAPTALEVSTPDGEVSIPAPGTRGTKATSKPNRGRPPNPQFGDGPLTGV